MNAGFFIVIHSTETGNSGWGDPRGGDPRSATAGLDPREMRIDPRDMRASSSDPMRMLDPRDQMRLVNSEMRGDPRGITGRLNGSGAEAMWGQPPQGPHHLHHQPGKMVGPGGNSAGSLILLFCVCFIRVMISISFFGFYIRNVWQTCSRRYKSVYSS